MTEKLSPYEDSFTGVGGVQLYCQRWLVENAKATMVVVHGLGEHSGRYGNVINHFAPLGYNVFLYDLRGHGKSEGQRGHVYNFDHYIEDTRIFVENAAERTKLPIILLGHSMGGLIALLFGEKYQNLLKLLAASGPAVKIAVKVPKWKEVIGKFVSNILPTLSMTNEIDPSLLSHDPEVVKAYENDPLVIRKVSARWFTEFLRAQKEVLDNAYKLELPLIVMQGGDDQIVDPEGAKVFYEKAGSKDKELKIYPGLYHEIFNEVEKEKVLSDLSSWIEKRI